MKIRKRLFLSYLAMLFIPAVLLSSLGILIIPSAGIKRVGDPSEIVIQNILKNLTEYIDKKETELKENPEKILSKEYWDTFRSHINNVDRTANSSLNYRHAFMLGIIILILTNGFLTHIVSRSITRPLEQLKKAAEKIKHGELEPILNTARKDEFHDVMTAFEEMRTRLKDSLDQQVQYEENRRELISGISHDLRTPLTAIRGYVEGIRDGVADSPQKLEKYLDTIHSKTILVDHLIDQLSLYSSLDIKKVNFHFQTLKIKNFLTDIIDEAAYDFKNLKISLQPVDEHIIINADPVHLKRVFFNIIENSIKYTDKKQTEIIISAALDSKNSIISIDDNGPGVETAALPHIFEKLYRGDPSRSSETNGSGLGLAICRKIISAHKGTITAENIQEPPVGLRIIIRLPVLSGEEHV